MKLGLLAQLWRFDSPSLSTYPWEDVFPPLYPVTSLAFTLTLYLRLKQRVLLWPTQKLEPVLKLTFIYDLCN